MVGSPPPTAEFLSKTVEELPERYIMKGGILDASPPVMDIPVIDVDLLSSLSNSDELDKLQYEYTEKTRLVNEVILKAMARSLKLEDNCFLDQYGERATIYARFNFYPPCPRPDLVLGLKAHADGSAITIVLQDKEVEGLQFLILVVLLLESDHSSAFHQESTLIAYIVTVMKRVVLRIPPKNFFTIKSLEQD